MADKHVFYFVTCAPPKELQNKKDPPSWRSGLFRYPEFKTDLNASNASTGWDHFTYLPASPRDKETHRFMKWEGIMTTLDPNYVNFGNKATEKALGITFMINEEAQSEKFKYNSIVGYGAHNETGRTFPIFKADYTPLYTDKDADSEYRYLKVYYGTSSNERRPAETTERNTSSATVNPIKNSGDPKLPTKG